MSIRLPGVTFPSTVPIAKPYAQQIVDRSDCLGWWTANPAHVVLDTGAVTTLNSRKAGGATFGQATAAARPSHVANAIADYFALGFDGGDYMACSDPLAALASGPFTIAAIFKAAGTASTQTIFSKRLDNASRIVLDIPANAQQVRCSVGNGTRALAATLGEWVVAVLSSNGTNTARLRANGVTATDLTHDNNIPASTPAIGSLSSSSFSLGLGAGARLADLMIFTAYWPSDATLLPVIERFAVETYGLGFTPA